jgi:predicted dehydrogenase
MVFKKYKLAFVGGAINSTIGKIHSIAATMDQRWEISAGFFSRNKKINLETAKLYGVDSDRVYNNFNNFINNEKDKIDAIVLLVPTPSRLKYLLKILKLKIPIISEKPLIDNYEAYKKLNKYKKNFLRVTYNYTGYPLVKELSELISNNYLGKIKQIHFEMPQDAFTISTSKNILPKKWRLKDKNIPNLSHDLGSHLLSLTYYLLGEYPSEVMCNYFKSSKYKNLVDNGYFFTKFKSGIRGRYWISKSVPGIRNGLKLNIIGEKKSAYWFQMRPEELSIYNENGLIQTIDNLTLQLKAHQKKYNRYKVGHPAGFLEAFANMYSDYYDEFNAFKNKKKINKKILGLKNSQEIAKFFYYASISYKQNCWIKI